MRKVFPKFRPAATHSSSGRHRPWRRPSFDLFSCDIFLFPWGGKHYIMCPSSLLMGRGHYIMEIKIATRRCADSVGTQRCFHYFLTVDQEEAAHLFCENYGVHITEEQGGDASIPAITTSARRIDELMTLLVDNQVGPAGLADVVADWL